MNEIEVGDWIRTDSGYIRQVIDFCDCKLNHVVLDKSINGDTYILQEDIVKHSKNKIDLVELYDYVNGFLVFDIITYIDGTKLIKLTNGTLLGNDEIETLVTYEQFKSFSIHRNL